MPLARASLYFKRLNAAGRDGGCGGSAREFQHTYTGGSRRLDVAPPLSFTTWPMAPKPLRNFVHARVTTTAGDAPVAAEVLTVTLWSLKKEYLQE